jgi:hypothetical protein
MIHVEGHVPQALHDTTQIANESWLTLFRCGLAAPTDSSMELAGHRIVISEHGDEVTSRVDLGSIVSGDTCIEIGVDHEERPPEMRCESANRQLREQRPRRPSGTDFRSRHQIDDDLARVEIEGTMIIHRLSLAGPPTRSLATTRVTKALD